MSRVLVTRAQPGADATAQLLGAEGIEPVVEPLFTLELIATELPPFDALAFTSANGVRAFAALSKERDAPVYCVGARTAEAAKDAGFPSVLSADGDVSALAELIARRLSPGDRLLHAGNEDSRGDLSGRLRGRGHDVEFRAVYRAKPITQPGPALAQHLSGSSAFDAVLIHSPRAASILAEFLAVAPGHAAIKAAAISQAASEPLQSLASRLVFAAHPDEPSLVSALKILLAKD